MADDDKKKVWILWGLVGIFVFAIGSVALDWDAVSENVLNRTILYGAESTGATRPLLVDAQGRLQIVSVSGGNVTYTNCNGTNCDIGWGNLTSVPAGFADGIDDVGAGSENCSVDMSCSLITYDSELAYIGNCSGKNCDIGWGNLTSVPAGFADGVDDTGSGSANCSVDNSCGLITYDSELAYINNCSVSNSCANVIYEAELTSLADLNTQLGSSIADGAHTVDTTIGNCSVDMSCADITYDSELAYIGNCSGANCDIGVGNITGDWTSVCIAITGSAGLCDGDDDAGAGAYTWNYTADFGTDGEILSSEKFNISGNGSAVVFSQTNGVIIQCTDTDTDTTIGNCSVDSSCSAVTYDSELAYIGNCSGDLSCDNVLYESELNSIAELNTQIADATVLISGGTLTNAKWCVYDGTGIDCNVEPVVDTNTWNSTSDIQAVAVGGDCSGTVGAITVTDDSHNHVYSNIDAFTEANLYTILSDVAQFWENGDSVTGCVGANEAYGAGWNGDTSVPEKDDIYDAGFLQNILEDTTPELGGNIDFNNKNATAVDCIVFTNGFKIGSDCS